MGRIKNLKPSHYGFILDEDAKEYFFHSDNYNGDWDKLMSLSPPITSKGPVVQFTPTTSPKGLRATNVEFIGDL